MADPRLPRGRVARILKPAATGARAALGQAGAWARSLGGDDADKADRQLQQVIRSAQQVADTMGQMKGAFMKVGQMLSFADTSMLPPEAREVLATLQADAPPMSYELVAEAVEAELGAPPEKAFDWFSPAPMASASIGQVHMARLGDDEVVVKVQYPGVADAVAADLNNAGLMAAFVRTLQPFVRQYMGRIDVKALMEEVRGRVLEELDYEAEAANQQAFAERFAGHPFFRIPAVVEERSTARVLTSAYHDGMRWAAAVQQPQEQRDAWGEVICRFGFGNLYRYGEVNADPHPGNYLFHEDGTVTFLDFGCVKRFTPGQVEHMKAVGRAALADDADQFGRAMADAGFLPPQAASAVRAIYPAMRAVYLPVLEEQPWAYTPERSREMLETAMGLNADFRAVARDLEFPPDYLFLGRTAAGNHAILSGLRASGQWRAVFEEMWAAAEPATDLGRAEQAWRHGRRDACA